MASRRASIALLLIRLTAGTIFIAHALQKIFQYTLPGTQAAFGSWGIPAPGVMGPLIAYLEFIGGVALVAGLFTRLAALFLTADMAVAFFVVHLPAGFFVAEGGYEFVLLLAACMVTLLFAGPGLYSLDQAFFGENGSVLARWMAPRPLSHERI